MFWSTRLRGYITGLVEKANYIWIGFEDLLESLWLFIEARLRVRTRVA